MPADAQDPDGPPSLETRRTQIRGKIRKLDDRTLADLEELLVFTAELRTLAAPEAEPDGRVHFALARCLNDLSRWHPEADAHQRLAWMEEADRHYREVGLDFIWTSLRERQGWLLADLGRLDEAAAVAREAIEARTPEGTPLARHRQTWLLELESEIARRAGRYGDALAAIERQLALEEQPSPLGVILGARSQTWLGLGLQGRARRDAERAIALAREEWDVGESPWWIGQAYEDLANARLSGRDFEGARATAREALEDAELGAEVLERQPEVRASLRFIEGIAWLLGERHTEEGRARAREAFLDVLAVDGVGDDLRAEATAFLAWSALEDRDWEGCRSALADAKEHLEARGPGATPPGPPSLPELVVALEARLALDSAESRERLVAVRDRLRAAFDSLLERWSWTPVREGGVGFLERRNQAMVVEELMRLERELGGPEEGARAAFDVWLEVEAMSSALRARAARPASLDELRASLLARDRVALLVLVGPVRTNVFALDSTNVQHHQAAGSSTLLPLLRQQGRLLAALPDADADRDHADELVAVGQELVDALFPPELRALVDARDEVWIVAEEFARGLVFEALPWDGTALLGERKALAHLPTLSLGRLLAEGRAARNGSAPEHELTLVVAAQPSTAARERWPSLSPLVVDPASLTSLAAPYDRFADGTPTVAGALDSLARARVWQLVAHGVEDWTRDRPAGLVLEGTDDAESAVLWSDDLVAEDAGPSPELVVLATCRTGGGPERLGDPGAGRMSAAWFERGVPTVLHSPANLVLEPTLELSRTFHRELRAGASPAEALRVAREELAASPRWSAPFYRVWLRAEGLAFTPLYVSGGLPDSTGEAIPALVVRVVLVLVAGLLLALAVARVRARRGAAG